MLKLSVILIFLNLTTVFAGGFAQTVTLHADNISLNRAMKSIKKQTGYAYFLKGRDLAETRKNVNISRLSLADAMDKLLTGIPAEWAIEDGTIVVKSSPFKRTTNSRIDLSPTEIIMPDRVITGRVIDQDGKPLEGVSVIVKGTNVGATTDANGNYSLAVKDDVKILVFSMVGYSAVERVIDKGNVVNVMLEQDVSGLSEVVVVGYGEQRRRDITGAISTVDAKTIENRPITNVTQALQGVVPGLNIARTSGQPGPGANNIDFNIRGISTFSSNPVLTIIDGIPSALNAINPNDIESISVLKDAASAAIYGSRASGGVIIITTKSGKRGKPRINITSIATLQRPSRFPSPVSGHDQMIAQNEMRKNDGGPQKYTDEEIQASLQPGFKEWDWVGFMFNNALQTNQNISISGGSESQDYYVSFGYLNQDGIFLNSNYKRFNFQFNQNISLTEKLKLKYKVSYIPNKTIAPSSLSWHAIFQSSKLVGIKTDDGKWLSNSERVGDGRNALYAASKEGGQEVNNRSVILANLYLDYDLLKNLSLSASYGIVRNQSRIRNYQNKLTFYDQYDPEKILSTTDYNILNINNSSNNQHNLTLLSNYSKKSQFHNVTVLVGGTAEWYQSQNDRVITKDFLTDDIFVINAGSKDKSLWDISGSASDWALASLISRVTYSYKNKYFIETGGRYDGSSRFKKDIRWGFFPSASVGWIISDEDFLKNNRAFSFLKIRASWGQVGNQNVGLYSFANLLSQSSTYFGGTVYRAVGTATAPNPLLTWENKESTDIGIEGRLFSNLLEFNFDFFMEKTKDILLKLPVPTTFGQSAPVQNAGRVKNKGWELELTHRNSIGKLHYGLTLQLSDATNKVVDMKGISPIISGNQITEEGHPMNEWYGLKADGIFQTDDEVENHSFQNPATTPGDIKFQENGGDPNVINSDDRVRLGRSDSRFPFGIRLNFKYKNFDFIALGQGVMFNLIYSHGTASEGFYAEASTIRTYQMDRWTPDNPNARFPKFRNGQAISVNSQFSSFWLEQASYFRMKQLEIGYEVSESFLRKLKMERLRFFLSGQDLFVFTKYLGYDPEQPNAASYPLPRLLGVGLNINF